MRDACSKQGSADACGEVPHSTFTQPECTIALFVLRRRDPDAPRPFRVPLYPALPALFCATSAFLLYSSLAYTGLGTLVGVGVLAAGAALPPFLVPSTPAQEPPP